MFSFDTNILTQLLSNFGPFVGVLIFFIWRDWRREDRLSTRVEKLEKYQREILVDLVQKTTTILTQNTECLKSVGRIIEHYNIVRERNDAGCK